VPEEQAELEWKYYCGQERAFLRKRRTRLHFSEFEVLLQIGEGGYGQVFLTRKKDTKELCALKRMDKRILIKRGRVDSILVERDVLTSTKSPWLVKLLYSFQDHHHVYLAMEFVPGGDMRSLLNHVQSMKEEPAKFFMAEMTLAMVSLHSLGYLHRDLKPENYLIDEKGHVKLTDFGLAKGSLSPEWLDEMKTKVSFSFSFSSFSSFLSH
jgi:cell cycle protein kinase DBF2